MGMHHLNKMEGTNVTVIRVVLHALDVSKTETDRMIGLIIEYLLII
jgi:hypothetical protein